MKNLEFLKFFVKSTKSTIGHNNKYISLVIMSVLKLLAKVR